MLEVLGLEPHLVARKHREILARDEWRMLGNAGEALGSLLHSGQIGIGHYLRCIHMAIFLSR